MTLGRVSRFAAVAVTVASALVSGCASIAATVANIPAAFGKHDRIANQRYGEGERRTLDVYVPESSGDQALRPIIVFFYGGTWASGRKSTYKFVGATLADRGHVVVIPDYRVYPEVRFPDFVADAAQAVAWVRTHALEYGGDPDRIILMGHSAGAQIAALLAYEPKYLEAAHVPTNTIAGFVGLSGPYDLTPGNDAQLNAIFREPYGPSDWRPLERVTARAPRSLLIHGDADTVVWPKATTKLDAALRSAGVPVETHLIAERSHADTLAAISIFARGRGPVLDWVDAFVRATPAAPNR